VVLVAFAASAGTGIFCAIEEALEVVAVNLLVKVSHRILVKVQQQDLFYLDEFISHCGSLWRTMQHGTQSHMQVQPGACSPRAAAFRLSTTETEF